MCVIVIDYVMRTAIQGREDKLGFQLRKRKRRVPPITVTDMDFVDYIILERYHRSPRDAYSSRKISKTSRTNHGYRINEIHELQY